MGSRASRAAFVLSDGVTWMMRAADVRPAATECEEGAALDDAIVCRPTRGADRNESASDARPRLAGHGEMATRRMLSPADKRQAGMTGATAGRRRRFVGELPAPGQRPRSGAAAEAALVIPRWRCRNREGARRSLEGVGTS